MTRSDLLYCFVDTNSLIHFQTFDEVDWAEWLQALHVRLMLAPSVMREIEKFKDDHTNERRRKRVRTILAKLRGLLEGADRAGVATVRDNTTLAVVDSEPAVDWAPHHLDSGVFDDRLIASIHEFQQKHSGATVELVTNDFLLQQKAKLHGIRYRDPEAFIKRHELSSVEEVTIKNLEREIAELRNRSPKLHFGLLAAGKVVQSIELPLGSRPPGRPTDAQIGNNVVRLRREFEQEVRPASELVRREDVKAFEEEYQHYLVNTRVQLERSRAREFDPRYEMTFILENLGTAPAEDVEVMLQFPSGCFVVSLEDEQDDYDGFGELTFSRPIPDWQVPSQYRKYLPPRTQQPWSISYPEHYERQEIPTGPQYYTDRSHVSYQHPKLRPQNRW